MFILNDFSRRFCDVTKLTWAFYESVSNTNLCTKFKPPLTLSQNDVIFRTYGRLKNLKTIFFKVFVNTNLHAKFGTPMNFGLRLR